MSSSSTARSFLAEERGAALVEMAMILVPFILIIALVIEGGNLLWRHQIAAKSARDATRYLSRVQGLLGAGCVVDGGVLASAGDIAKTLGAAGRLDRAAGLLPGLNLDSVLILPPDVVAIDPCLVTVGAVVEVELALPFAPVFRLFAPASPDTLTFRVADRARYVGE